MRFGFLRNRYAVGIAICLLAIVGPVIFGLLLSVPSMIYPNDCDITARCEHSIVELAQSLGFGLIFLGPVLMLFGTLGLVVVGAIWGVHAFKNRNGVRMPTRYIKQFIGVVCSGTLAYLLYIPSGPDPCSRAFTDTKYEKCLENTFSDMSFSDTRQWLEKYGYRLTSNLKGGYGDGPALGIEDGEITFRYDKWFQSFRNHGRTKSVPYGTNFNRIFARIGPAPNHFELNVFGWAEEDSIVRAQVWWAFSFL